MAKYGKAKIKRGGRAISGRATGARAINGRAISGRAITGRAISGRAISGRYQPLRYQLGSAARGPRRAVLENPCRVRNLRSTESECPVHDAKCAARTA
jgi:hypothetical protein